MSGDEHSRCYLCSALLTHKSASREHIIPNALGGVLRSRRLLCVGCNGVLGHDVDAHLCNATAALRLLIGAERDHGVGRAVPIQRADGSMLLLDHEGRLRTPRPVFTETPFDGGVHLEVTAAARRDVEKAFAGLSRKWAKKFRKVSIDSVQESIVEVDERMHFHLQTGGPLTNRAIAKIALGFYLHAGGSRESVLDVIEFVRSGVLASSFDVGWYEGPIVLPAEGDAALRHVVAVRGSAADGRLMAYVELFGALQFAITLAQPYAGASVSRAHALELVGRTVRNFDAAELLGYPWRVVQEPSRPALERGLTSLMRRANALAAERRFHRKWDAELTRAIHDAMAACADGRSEIPIDELRPHLMRELQPVIEAYTRDLIDRRRRRETAAVQRPFHSDAIPSDAPTALTGDGGDHADDD